MKMKAPEFQKQAVVGSEAKIRMAPFIERRLFYLINKLCYKRTLCD